MAVEAQCISEQLAKQIGQAQAISAQLAKQVGSAGQLDQVDPTTYTAQ